MSNPSNWYGVKIIYRIEVVGEPLRMDSHFKNDYTAYEESVVIFKATSFDEAYDMAKVHAREYEDEYTNYYGQKVVTTTLDLVDCFLMDEDVDLGAVDGVEVYSRLIESTTSVDADTFLKEQFNKNAKPAYMLLNVEFSESRPGDEGKDGE